MSDEEVNTVENGDVVEKNETLSEEDALKEEVRRFSIAVTDPSVRAHGMAYASLTKLVERAEQIPAPFVKGLVKLSVVSSIRTYGQPKSFQHVSKLLLTLAKRDYETTLKALLQTIVSALPVVPNLSESRSISQVPTAKWILSLLAQKEAEEDVARGLATISYWMSGSPKAWKIFVKKLAGVLKANKKLQGAIEKEASAIGKEHPETVIALLSAVSAAQNGAILPVVFVDLLTKTILLAKSRPPQFLVDRVSTTFVKHLTEKDFNENLLPNIKKALLRSPEVAIYGIQGIVENVSFSLDAAAADLLKATAGSLQSADESLREAATSIAVALTRKAQPPVITRVVNTLFDQLSAAKTPENRISLLQGVARVAKVAENQDVDKIADDVIGKTGKADKDTHDGTVEAQWNACVEWAARLSKPSAALTVAFKEASKVAPAVRYIAYRALSKILEKRQMTLLPDGIDAKPLLTELETGPKGELCSIGLALAVLKTSKKGSVEHTKAWSRASHAESLFKEKSLGAMKWQEAVAWAKLAELVILQRPVVDKSAAPNYSSSALRALSLVLFWPHWKVRRHAFKSLLNILDVEKATFAEALADLIYSETANGTIDALLRRVPGCPSAADWEVPGEWYVSTLKLLLTPNEPELDKLAIHTLLLASVQRLVEVDGSVWLRWVHEHRESKTWQASEQFRETAIRRVLGCEHRGVRNTALITLIALHDEHLRTDLWKHVETNIRGINVADYGRITEKEISIYKCPDGQLFNTAVLDFDEAAGIKGQKGASIQDQLAEIQLIRELAEKRRKEGKLSAKQKQVMDKELASEKETREALTELFNTAEAKLDEARAMVNADPQGAFARP